MKILVVDDHALVRAGLCQVLQGLDPTEATQVLEAPDCARAFVLANHHPDLDLVLLDCHLPDMNGLAALAVFGEQHPELPVAILSGSANPAVAQAALTRGAAGFITKSGLSDELLHALHQILNGEVYLAPEYATPGPASSSQNSDGPPTFTPRQLEVLHLLTVGFSNRDIGEHLALSEETVKNHVSSILRSFGVKTRTQAALQANRWGYDRPTPNLTT